MTSLNVLFCQHPVINCHEGMKKSTFFTVEKLESALFCLKMFLKWINGSSVNRRIVIIIIFLLLISPFVNKMFKVRSQKSLLMLNSSNILFSQGSKNTKHLLDFYLKCWIKLTNTANRFVKTGLDSVFIDRLIAAALMSDLILWEIWIKTSFSD